MAASLLLSETLPHVQWLMAGLSPLVQDEVHVGYVHVRFVHVRYVHVSVLNGDGSDGDDGGGSGEERKKRGGDVGDSE